MYPSLLATITSKNFNTTSGNTASPSYLPSLLGVGGRKRYMANSPCGGLDRSNHLGHLLHHFFHGFCGQLPDDEVKGLGRHYEADRLVNR
jgi:hypothetical protein